MFRGRGTIDRETFVSGEEGRVYTCCGSMFPIFFSNSIRFVRRGTANGERRRLHFPGWEPAWMLRVHIQRGSSA
jgi:hypothetical protein